MAVFEAGAYSRPRRNLKLWSAIGLSPGVVGPTLAPPGATAEDGTPTTTGSIAGSPL
jgi:hypothetical protein